MSTNYKELISRTLLSSLQIKLIQIGNKKKNLPSTETLSNNNNNDALCKDQHGLTKTVNFTDSLKLNLKSSLGVISFSNCPYVMFSTSSFCF